MGTGKHTRPSPRNASGALPEGCVPVLHQRDDDEGKWELESTLARALGTLPARYQKVVFLYYTNEMTMKEIGNWKAHSPEPSERFRRATRRLCSCITPTR